MWTAPDRPVSSAQLQTHSELRQDKLCGRGAGQSQCSGGHFCKHAWQGGAERSGGLQGKVGHGAGNSQGDLGVADLTSYTQYRYDRTPTMAIWTRPPFRCSISSLTSGMRPSRRVPADSKPGRPCSGWQGQLLFEHRQLVRYPGCRTHPGKYQLHPLRWLEHQDQILRRLCRSHLCTRAAEAVPDAGGRYSHDIVTDAYFKTNEFTVFTGYTGPNGQTIAFAGPRTQSFRYLT